MRGLAELVDRVLERQVVELRRRVQAIEVLAMAEHRRALVGLVAADALEDPGAVVQPVAQDMDLGVVPSDELAIHPDPFRLFHGAPWGRLGFGKVCRKPTVAPKAELIAHSGTNSALEGLRPTDSLPPARPPPLGCPRPVR